MPYPHLMTDSSMTAAAAITTTIRYSFECDPFNSLTLTVVDDHKLNRDQAMSKIFGYYLAKGITLAPCMTHIESIA